MKQESEDQKATIQQAAELSPSPKQYSPYAILGELGKITLFVVFSLYSIGFLIWHSFLGQYGLSSVNPSQMDYLSAAVCYVGILTALGLPLALVSQLVFTQHDVQRLKFNLQRIPMVWLFICLCIQSLYFPGDLAKGNALLFAGITATIVLHILYVSLCPQRWRGARPFRLLYTMNWIYLYLFLYVAVICLWRPNVNYIFVFLTTTLYSAWYGLGGRDILRRSAELDLSLKILLNTSFCLLV